MIEEIYALPPFLMYAISFVTALVVSAYIVKRVIYVTQKVKIYDTPDITRKTHGATIPSMGGIGLFVAYMTVGQFFMFGNGAVWNVVMVSSIILFFTGVYDDILNMRPTKKLVIQLLAASITVFFTDIHIHSLYGLLGIQHVSYWVGCFCTVVGCTFFINVFNFIDGIDGLACMLSLLATTVLGCLFAGMGHLSLACVLYSLAGASAGLLIYNASPAKIYMGDTGSMLLGFSIFIFCVIFLNKYAIEVSNPISAFIHSPQAAIMLVFAIMFMSVFDGIRVFVLRMAKGVSPMKADRLHLHYYLLDAGCTHTQAAIILVVINMVIIALAWFLQDMNWYVTLSCFFIIASAATWIVNRIKKVKQRNQD